MPHYVDSGTFKTLPERCLNMFEGWKKGEIDRAVLAAMYCDALRFAVSQEQGGT